MATQKLTNTVLRDLPLGEYVWDSERKGLAVRQPKDGAPTFYVRYRVAGKQHRRVIGEWRADSGGLSIADARATATQIITEARVGKTDALAPQIAKASSDAKTVAWAVAFHLRRLAEDGTSKKYRETVAWAFEKYVLPRIGEKPIADVVRSDLTDLLAEIDAPVMRNRVGTYLSGLFNRAVKQAWVDASVATNFDRVKERKRQRVLSDEEIVLLWQATEDLPKVSGDLGRVLRFILLTGARKSTATGARMSEFSTTTFKPGGDAVAVEEDVAVWTVPASNPSRETKTETAYDVFPPALAMAQLPENRDASDLVFQGRDGGELLRQNATRAVASIHAGMEKLAGREIEPWTPHALRHTLITWMAKQGKAISMETRYAVVNHSMKGIGATYNHHDYRAEKRDALRLWGEHVASLVA